MLPDNLAEYADPETYDLENQEFEPDGPFFIQWAKELNGPVLELGCGTGRVTIPLAQAGIPMTGLDIVPGMIERAKEKASELPIQWVVGDVRTFQLQHTFRLIFEIGSVFQHLLTREDQESFLQRVSEHLDGDGRLILCLMFPHPDMLVSEEDEKAWYTYQDPRGHEVRVSGTEIYDPVRQVKLETAYRRWQAENGSPVERVAPLSLRYVFPQEMSALLHYNGFEIDAAYGDWDRSPLTGATRIMILVCKKRCGGPSPQTT